MIFSLEYLLQYSPGWGKWWPHKGKTYSEVEIPEIDKITTKYLGYAYTSETSDEDAVRYKTIAFNFRMGLYSIPLYITACLASWSLIPLLALFVMFTAGYVYRDAYRYQSFANAIPWAEKEFGKRVGLIQSVIVGLLMLLK